MSGFRFSLQALLDHRSMIEKRFHAQATAYARALTSARAHLRALFCELQNTERSPDLRAGALRGDYLSAALRSQKRIVEDHESVLGIAQRRLREAAKETLVLERLKERRYRAYIDAIERSEDAELDDSNRRRRSAEPRPRPASSSAWR